MTYLGKVTITEKIGTQGTTNLVSSSAASAGIIYFTPKQGFGSYYLRTIMATTNALNAGFIQLYNVTSGTYVHIGGPSILQLSTSNTTPTTLTSVELSTATNFDNVSASIYEVQYYGSGSSPITIHYGSEIYKF